MHGKPYQPQVLQSKLRCVLCRCAEAAEPVAVRGVATLQALRHCLVLLARGALLPLSGQDSSTCRPKHALEPDHHHAHRLIAHTLIRTTGIVGLK